MPTLRPPRWAQQGKVTPLPGSAQQQLCPDLLSQALHTAPKQPVVTASLGGPVLKRGTVGVLTL